MDPAVWGPHAWFFMYSVAMKYPSCPNKRQKKLTYQFFRIIGMNLPCDSCQINFSKHWKKHPLNARALSSRSNLLEWVTIMYNEVRKSQNKKPVTVEEALAFYEKAYQPKTPVPWHLILISMIFVLLLVQTVRL